MEPSPYVCLLVDSLSLTLHSASNTAGSGTKISGTTTITSATAPCFCTLRLSPRILPSQTSLVPLSSSSSAAATPESSASTTTFHLDPTSLHHYRHLTLKVSVYTGRMGGNCFVGRSKKLLGRAYVKLDLNGAQLRPVVYQNGWVKLGKEKEGKVCARVHVVVRSEPDPRYVFQFGGEPECSPVIYQVRGGKGCVRQPVFSCKFSADRNSRSR